MLLWRHLDYLNPRSNHAPCISKPRSMHHDIIATYLTWVTDATEASAESDHGDVGTLFVHRWARRPGKLLDWKEERKFFWRPTLVWIDEDICSFSVLLFFWQLEEFAMRTVPFMQAPFLFDTGLMISRRSIDDRNASWDIFTFVTRVDM
jgi:hypothetical protein